MDKDITASVQFGYSDDEYLPLTKCACGRVFPSWAFVLGVYRDRPQTCPQCGRKLYFSVSITVYEIVPEPRSAGE